MKIAIMQPTYLPWLGYFSLICQADRFVFLDTVQFVKRSWMVRNRIKTQTGELFLTIPIKHEKSSRETLIFETKINYSEDWVSKHLSSIWHSYKKAPCFEEIYGLIQKELKKNYEFLSDLNISLIDLFTKYLGIEKEFIKSSSLGKFDETKDQLLLTICKSFRGSCYISPIGSSEYIEKEIPGGAFADSGIRLEYLNYTHPIHKQLHGEFIPYMGVVDLLFNYPPKEAIQVIRSGEGKNFTSLDLLNNVS